MSYFIEPVQLDVRLIPSPEKHATVFASLEALPSGGSLVLFNDHDPLPLRAQLEGRRPGHFAWNYLQQGPIVWRVQISKA